MLLLESEQRRIRADLDHLCSRPVRIAILHLLLNSVESGHCLSLKRIAQRLGKRPSLIHYHLKELERYGLVEQVSRRSKHCKSWGLCMHNMEGVKLVYAYALRNFYTQRELEKFCNSNLCIQ